MYTLCYFHQLSASILLIGARLLERVISIVSVERGSARVPLSVSIELKLAIAYRSFGCASGLYTILSHIDFNHFFLVVTIDCYQCLMILIVGMCMGSNMILKFFVTILCFALKHKSEACIVTIL